MDRWDGRPYYRLLPLDNRAVDIAVVQTSGPDNP